MKSNLQNPFLNTQQIQLNTHSNSSSNQQHKHKLKASPSTKNKTNKPIISFINFTQIKKNHLHNNQNNINTHCRTQKEENFIFYPQSQQQQELKSNIINYTHKEHDTNSNKEQNKNRKEQNRNRKEQNMSKNINNNKKEDKQYENNNRNTKKYKLSKQKQQSHKYVQFIQLSNTISQVGSQYGQKNYDNQLKIVLSKNKRQRRKQYLTPKLNLTSKQNIRSNTDQNQVILQHRKYERFEKFQYEINQQKLSNNNNNNKQLNKNNQILLQNKQIKNIKLSKFYTQSSVTTPNNNYNRNKLTTDINQNNINNNNQNNINNNNNNKNINNQYRISQLDSQQINLKQTLKYQQSLFQPFFNNNTTFQPIQFIKSNINSPSHRRSRTQQDVTNIDSHQSQLIFKNYQQLKLINKPLPKYKQYFQNHYKPKTISQKQINHKQSPIIYERIKKNDKQPKKYYKSLPKYQPVMILQNTFNIDNSSTTRMTPQSLSKGKIDQKSIRRLIKSRQKDFFQKVNNTKSYQSTNFTFQQIKSRLAQLQQSTINKKNYKSSSIINNNKNALLYSQLYMNNNMQKQISKENNNKDCHKVIKFKGLSFKANLVKKHTDLYQKHMKKRIMENHFSSNLTPKVSKIGL